MVGSIELIIYIGGEGKRNLESGGVAHEDEEGKESDGMGDEVETRARKKGT